MQKQLLKISCYVGIFIMIFSMVVIPDKYPWYYEALLFNVGMWLWLFTKWKRKQVFQSSSTTRLVIVFLFTCILKTAGAQDYSKPLDALKQSFKEKDVSFVNPYLGEGLKFDPLPVENTPAIVNNIVTKLPFISMEVVSTSSGMVTVKYNFQGLGERVSNVHFNDQGKFERIELIENLIKMEIEQRKQMQASVQQPGTNSTVEKYQPEVVEITAKDGLKISGNLYEITPKAPVILLCHQAGYNKAEYNDIAPQLNELGFNCLAIDQRSGGSFAGVSNQTAKNAKSDGMDPSMLDAQQDLKAAIDYLGERYSQNVIVWGSSYSSSLALFELAENKKVKAAIAFSPGDYFGDESLSLSKVFMKTKKPYLVTSSKAEAPTIQKLIASGNLSDNQIQFIPESDGFHGSRVLWIGQKGADEYWAAVTDFLSKVK